MTTRFKGRISKLVREFGQSSTGVAAIEFAYIAPILMLLSFGTFEAARGVLMHKRFQRASAMVGNLVAREQALGTDQATATAELNGIMNAAVAAMLPFSSSALKIGVYSVHAHSTQANNTRVEWSFPFQGATVLNKCNAGPTEANNLVSLGNSVIAVEAQYTYTPVLANLVPGFKTAMTWNDKLFNSPRNSCVNYAGQNCILVCPGW